MIFSSFGKGKDGCHTLVTLPRPLEVLLKQGMGISYLPRKTALNGLFCIKCQIFFYVRKMQYLGKIMLFRNIALLVFSILQQKWQLLVSRLKNFYFSWARGITMKSKNT